MADDNENSESPANPFAKELEEHLLSVKSPVERQSILELTRDIARLPLDQARAALETGAAIAGVSLRVSIEFLRAAPAATHVLETAELRSWGEMGRRIALADIETAVSFFVAGVEDFEAVPQKSRPLAFQVCLRQMTLSSAVATETFRSLPQL